MANVWKCFLLVCVCGTAAVAIAAEPIEIKIPPRTEPVDFKKDVLPLLRANCLACHNATKAESELVLETPQTIKQGGASGPAVVPGKSDDSLLLKLAAHRQESFMPPDDNDVGAKSLGSQELGLLKLWIDQGARGDASAQRKITWRGLSTVNPIFATAVTTDGKLAACSRANRLFVYHLPTKQLVAQLADPTLGDTGSSIANPNAQAAHRSVVRSLAFSADGSLLASGGYRSVKIWRRPRLTKHSQFDLAATTLAAHADWSAAANDQGQIWIWRTADAKAEPVALGQHAQAVTGLAFTADGKLLSVSRDKTLRIWSLDKASQTAKVELDQPATALTLASGSKLAAIGLADGHILIGELATLAAIDAPPSFKEIKAHSQAVTALAAPRDSPDDTRLFSAAADGKITAWELPSGKRLRDMSHQAPLTALAVAPNGSRLASAGEKGIVRLWNTTDGQQLAAIAGDPRALEAAVQIDAQAAFTKSALEQLNRDIKAYAGQERRVKVTAEALKKAQDELTKAKKKQDEQRQAFDKAKADNKPDDDAGKKKIAAAEKAFREAETAAKVAKTIVDRAQVIAQRAEQAFADAKAQVTALEVKTKAHAEQKKQAEAAAAGTIVAVRSLAFSSNGRRLFVGDDQHLLRSYDAASGAAWQTVDNHQAAVGALAVAGQRLVSAAADGKLLLWHAPARWRLAWQLNNATAPQAAGNDSGGRVPVDRVLALDFSPDGRRLAIGGGEPSRSAELAIWSFSDLSDNSAGKLQIIPQDARDTVFAVRFSPDGKHLVAGGADHMVDIFDVASGKKLRCCAGHTAHVLGVSFSSDGRWLASCGTDMTVKLWDFESGTAQRTFKGNTYRVGPYKREVTSVSFLGASQQILAASGDGTVRLHRTTSDSDLHMFSTTAGYVYAAAASPDGLSVVAGGDDGVLRVWSGHGRSPIHEFAAPSPRLASGEEAKPATGAE